MSQISKILVVDDDPDIVEILRYNLSMAGYDVKSAINGKEGIKKAKIFIPQIILLDVMMPEMDGIQACSLIKEIPSLVDTRIVFLSARSEDYTQISAFDAGADDYITKPFSPKELVARVKAVLRRGTLVESAPRQDQVKVGKLAIDPAKYEVTVAGNEIRLTATEFRLLHYLASNPGRVFSREQLLSRAMGDDVVVVDRNIDVHIRGIRKKMNTEPPMIETIRGVGYRLRDSV